MIRHISAIAAATTRQRSLRCVTGFRSSSSAATTPPPQSADEFDMGASFTYTDAGGFVRHSAFPTVRVPNLRIDQFVWKDLQRWERKTALVCGETDRQLTYAQLRDHCAAVAVRLQRPEFGLADGDVVALCLPNCPDFPIACLGAIEAGLTVTTVNPLYTAEEIAKQLVASQTKVLFGTAEKHATLQQAIQISRLPIRLVCVRFAAADTLPADCIDFGQLADPTGVEFGALRQSADFNPNSVAFLPFSSGTTGLPKGVMLSHNNIATNCLQMDGPMPVETLVWPTTADHQDVLPSVLPFFHIYGFTVGLAGKLALGCKLVTLRQFAPDTFLKALVTQRGTVLYLVPPIVNFLADHPSVQAHHLRDVRSVLSGAAPMRASDVERFVAKVGHPIHVVQGYGMTETSPVTIVNAPSSNRYSSSGGLAANTEAKICAVDDPLFRGLAANQSGELLVRGPQVMQGYFNNPTATAEILLPDGWLRTGDVAHYDEQGYFYVTDRLKELIKVKGFQVAPAELEALLRAHPQVSDVAVIGMQHPTSGEVPLAFVVRQTGVDEVTETQLQEYVAERVAAFKKLEGGVRFVEAIPKNATGKILRRELKRIYNVK